MLLKDDKKKGLVTVIMKRMKGHGDMSPSLPSGESEIRKSVEGAEKDYEHGYDACCEDMISAVQQGDAKKLKAALKSFYMMMEDEEDSMD